ncbi:flagellar protein FliT [Anoxybacillus flavithermus]|uniref:Flagellar protein FliT n=1 Tax=Anoxybacillus flavithermus TaxID=33934 RepID=A0A2G5RPI1_9BACL|nr:MULTISPECIES: flagellar protein [Anoxybacillus]KFZ43309.1 flagellar protein [Anoxybacillus sp. KU2-6(11)]PIC04694.1 flagellar protein FliT [Anoxybacillus flavithermus]
MSVVSELLEATAAIVTLLRGPIEREKREAVIEQIEQLLEKREQLLQSLSTTLTDEEKQIGKQLLALDQEANALLQQLKQQIQQDLKQTKQTKVAVERYDDIYDSLAIDGMFYDKRR